MDDLVTFLRQCLDEDERTAQAAAGGGQWRYEGGDSVGAWTLYDEHWSIASLTTYDTAAYDYAARMPALRSPGYVDPDANGRHIARHDPARVLRDVAAKRAIVDLHYILERKVNWVDDEGEDRQNHQPVCVVCVPKYSTLGEDHQTGPCLTVRHLAAVYADRPGYKSEWAPDG